jgi:dihydroflavonol-4-reductase
MRIALTGAAGHLGSAILPELHRKGYQIKALIKDSEYAPAGFPVEVIKGDLLEAEILRNLLKDCDGLIHCAAIISINGDPNGLVYKTNVEGTKRVMEMAEDCGIKRVVHISSIHAFKQYPSFEPLDETRVRVDKKAFAYDQSKKAGEEIAISMNQPGMEVLVMNPTSIIGPFDSKPSKMGRVIIDLCNGRLPFVFKGGFDFCDCRDVARAIVNGLTKGRPGENYILGGKWCSFKQLIQLISKASGRKITAFNLPSRVGRIGLPLVHGLAWLKKSEPLYTGEALEAIFAGNRKINSAKAISELDYHIRPLEETLADTFRWFQQKGYLV